MEIHAFLYAMIAYGSILLKHAILMIYVSDNILETVSILKLSLKQNKGFTQMNTYIN